MNTAEPLRVLVTGGGRGIGRRVVERLIDDGFETGVLELRDDLCDEIRQTHKCHVWQCNVADQEDVDRCLQNVLEDGFIPDVLINNAGIIHSEPLVNLLSREDKAHSRKNWRKVLAADLDSIFYITSRLVEKLMTLRRRAVVISISSISAYGNPGQSAYSAAKAGVEALTKTWSKELGMAGFRFVAVAPGFLDTDSTRAAVNAQALEKLRQQVPLRRLGTPDHIYQTIRYAMDCDYVNGTVLHVDGGLVI